VSWDTEWDEPVQDPHPWRRLVVIVLVVGAMLAGVVLPLVILMSGT
jgi:hypothetical protein